MNLVHLVGLVGVFVFLAEGSTILQYQGKATEGHAYAPSRIRRHDVSTQTLALNLYIAAQDGDLVAVNSALDHGANPLWRNPDANGYTALHVAAYYNKDLVVKALVKKGVSPNLFTSGGITPLFAAASHGSVEALEALIVEGADVNQLTTDIPDGTPLHIAAKTGHLSAVNALIKAGAKANKPNSNGYTPLMSVARYGHLSVAEALLATNIDINAVNNDGEIALHRAARYNKPILAHLLLQNGANKSKQNNEGQSPGDVAKQEGHTKLGDFIENYQPGIGLYI